MKSSADRKEDVMKITVEHQDILENEIVLRCKTLDEEMLNILTMLKSQSQRLCVWEDEEAKELTFLSPAEILYGESLEEKTYLYGPEHIYRTALTLAELCDRYEGVGYFRISKPMIVNLHKISRLQSCNSGRIKATMKNGERIMISRHYAPLLRQKLGL